MYNYNQLILVAFLARRRFCRTGLRSLRSGWILWFWLRHLQQEHQHQPQQEQGPRLCLELHLRLALQLAGHHPAAAAVPAVSHRSPLFPTS